MSDYSEMREFAESRSSNGDKCLRCDKITNHASGVCMSCRTQKCAHPDCKNKIKTPMAFAKKVYCNNHKFAAKKLRSLGEA